MLQQRKRMLLGRHTYHKIFSPPKRRGVQETQGKLTICVSLSLGNLNSFPESATFTVAIMEVRTGLGART